MKKFVKFCFISTFILFIIAGIGSCGNQETKKEVVKEEIKPTRQQQVESLFSKWDGSNIDLELYVKDHMNDPDSFKHIETRFKDLGDYIMVSMEFTGKNAFGGTVRNKVYAKMNIDGSIIEVKQAE